MRQLPASFYFHTTVDDTSGGEFDSVPGGPASVLLGSVLGFSKRRMIVVAENVLVWQGEISDLLTSPLQFFLIMSMAIVVLDEG